MRVLQRLTSLRALTVGFVVFTLLAIGPLRQFEADWHVYWARTYPDSVTWFLQQVLDRISGQAVCLPVLAIVAVVIAYRRRTWRPIFIVLATEFAFFGGVGLLKLILARPSPELQDPSFFSGGLFTDGWSGISYPSGHASESILVYGAAAYLIIRYGRPSERLRRIVVWAVGVIAVITVVTAYLLGWHWTTDIVAGLFVGGILLHLVVLADRHVIARWFPEKPAPLPASEPPLSVDADPRDLQDRQLRTHA